MMRLLILLFFVPMFVPAQNKPLVIEGIAPDLYISHTVAPKENYYSIGRIYNISPKEIAPYNNLAMENGLSLGQTLKIPLQAVNFLQSGNAAPDEALVPVYHTVEGKEGLYRVSVNYNKVPVESIRQWNNLSSETVSNGTNLIVGYLKVKKELSLLAGMATVKPFDPVVKVTENTSKAAEVKPQVAEESIPAGNATNPNPPAAEVVKKEPVTSETPTVKRVSTFTKGKNFNGGVFKSDYEKQTRERDVTGETGEAAVFKSTSGWEDGKYYCLHNTSSPGTIVKVTNASNGKSVYAKVLDVIPDIKQNTGLVVRISNAAAEELGAGEKAFECKLSYSK